MADDREESLEKRRAQLGAELATKRAEAGVEHANEAQAEVSRKGYAQAMKLSSEFIAAIVVLLLRGFCAGVLNVLRSAGVVAHPLDDKDDKK